MLEVSLTGVIFFQPVYSPDGATIIDLAYVHLNPAAQRMLQLPPRPSDTFLTLYPNALEMGIFAFYRDTFLSGKAGRYDVNYSYDGLDNYFHLSAQPSGAVLVVSFTDTSDQPRTVVEQALRQSQARERQARAEAETERQRLHDILMQLPAQVAINRGPYHVYELVNPRYQQQFPLRSIQGLPVREALPELEGQQFFELLDQVYQTGEPFYGHKMPAQVDYTHSGQMEMRYFDVFFQALRNSQGVVDGILNFAYDVTEQVEARQQVEGLNEELEARVQQRTHELQAARPEVEAQRQLLQSVLTQAPVAIGVFQGDDLVVTQANDRLCATWGYEPAQVLGEPLLESVPELRGQGFDELIRQVSRTRVPFVGTEAPAVLRKADGQLETHYFNFVYQPLYGPDGQLMGVLDIATDVTGQVEARKQAEVLQAQVLAATVRQMQERETFYQVFEQTPASIVLLQGPEHRVEYHNEAYQQLFPGRQMKGRTIAEIQPDAAEQGFVALLDGVYQTGETYFGRELQLDIDQPDGTRKETYFNFTYQAYRENGQISGVSVFAYDVTGQVLARREREAQQRKLYALFEQAPIGICIFAGSDLVYEFINPRYQRLLPDRKLLGRPLLEVIPELVGTDVERLLRRVYQTGETQQEQDLLIPVARAEGQQLEDRYFTIVYQARRDEQGRINGILNFVVEVTEGVRARKAIEASEARFRSLAENSPDVITRHGKDFTYLYASPRIEGVMGIKAEACIGKSYWELGLEEALCTLFDEHLSHVFARQTLHTLEYSMPEGKGYILSRMVPEWNEAGEVVSVLVLSTDISERKRAEAALRSSEERMQKALSIQTVGVIFFDLAGKINDANVAFQSMSGYSREDFVRGKVRWDEVTPPEFREVTLRSREEFLTKGENTPYEKQYIRPDGSRWWGLFSGKRLSETECVEFVLDITERKESEEALQHLSQQLAGANKNLSAANQLLTHINQDLDTFVYTASHDLKSPILNVEGLLKALQRQLNQKEANQQEIGTIFGFLNDSVGRFKTTIADLTEVARISKESSEDVAPIDLEEILGQVQLDLAPQITQANATIDVRLDCPLIHFSRKNLKSILYNLLSNAVKYRSPDRTPLIGISCQPQGEYYCLTVQDNGLGMDMRQEEKIFALFKRLHNHVEGTGIGLYIVKKILENAGGRIEVESQVDVGSTFRVYFKR